MATDLPDVDCGMKVARGYEHQITGSLNDLEGTFVLGELHKLRIRDLKPRSEC